MITPSRSHDPDPDTDFRVRLRSVGQPDLHVVVEGGNAALAWGQDSDADEATLDLDPAARHLFIWGRRPDRRNRLRSHLELFMVGEAGVGKTALIEAARRMAGSDLQQIETEIKGLSGESVV